MSHQFLSDFLPVIELHAETYDRIMSWRSTIITLLVIFIVFRYIFPIENLIAKYILYPLVAASRKGVWTKYDRFWAHERMLRKKFERNNKEQNDDDEDEEECPELIPADPIYVVVTGDNNKKNPQNHSKKKK
jgi:hypothetical protein